MITVICVICGLNHLEKKDVPKSDRITQSIYKSQKNFYDPAINNIARNIGRNKQSGNPNHPFQLKVFVNYVATSSLDSHPPLSYTFRNSCQMNAWV
jgi:hypothetical protein